MQVNDILVFDAETSLHNERGKFKAHPQCKDNWIVWMGVASLRTDTLEMAGEPTLVRYKDIKSVEINAPANSSRMLLVGHNIGFDLHYLLNVNNKERKGWIDYINHPDSLIWDTQIAEYRLRGQSMMSPSLDGVCEARGWETKPGRLKEYWANGISTEDIPDDEVRPYLKHDVSTTAKLFRVQILEAAEKGMLDMLRIEMQSRLTTILMEHNGMAFQAEAALKENAEVIAPRLKLVQAQALAALRVLTRLPEVAVKPNSTTFLKQFLYGGTVKWREQHPMMDENGDPVLFKSGKKKGEAKLKWHDKEQVLPAASPLAGTKADEDMLNKIQAHSKCSADLSHALSLVLEFRDLNKQSTTYFEGYAALTWEDGMIHGNLNHAIAATGRLSSTNPNLQNAGHSPIRAHFKSRYPGGHLMEVDLSQIEVVVQAFLSADVNMRNDIINGIDFHSKRAAFAHNADYDAVKQAVDDASHPEHDTWTKIRKGAKIVSFQKAYGAGVKKISETTGLSRNAVKAFMDAEDQNYPFVPTTQENWISEVKMSTGIRDGRACGVLKSPINVEYRFFQDNYNGHLDFKPTTIKNYPIQGFSADILKIIMSGLRGVVNDFNAEYTPEGGNPVLIINTVHDSVIFDLPSWVDEVVLARRLVAFFTEHPINVLRDTFGVDFNIPISADADIGMDWYNMKGIEL